MRYAILPFLMLLWIFAPVPVLASPVAGADTDRDGLWDDDYRLFLYAMGDKTVPRPEVFSKNSSNLVKDWRRRAALPAWGSLKPLARRYYRARFWHYQETLANADNAGRSVALARDLNTWVGCYKYMGVPVKQMIGIGPFLQQVMLARFDKARLQAESDVGRAIAGQVFEVTEPESTEACEKILDALPLKPEATP